MRVFLLIVAVFVSTISARGFRGKQPGGFGRPNGKQPGGVGRKGKDFDRHAELPGGRFEDGGRPTRRPKFGGRPSKGNMPGLGRPDFDQFDLEQICAKSKNCPKKFERPVCGTDGETYDGLCQLLSVKCEEENLELGIEHIGACGEETEGQFADKFLNRHDPERRKAMCEHRTKCSNSSEGPKVCGSNNVTYADICHFNISKCEDIFITVATEGECTEDQGDPEKYCVQCPIFPRQDEETTGETTGEPLLETETDPEGEFMDNRPHKEEHDRSRGMGYKVQQRTGRAIKSGYRDPLLKNGFDNMPDGDKPGKGKPNRPWSNGTPADKRPNKPDRRQEGGRERGGGTDGSDSPTGRDRSQSRGGPDGSDRSAGRDRSQSRGAPADRRSNGRGRLEGGGPNKDRSDAKMPEGPNGSRQYGDRLSSPGGNKPEGDIPEGGRPGPHHGNKHGGKDHDGKHHGGGKDRHHERKHHRGRRPEHHPVCGTDNITYKSLCELKRTACLLREFDLDVQSFGPCPRHAEEEMLP